MFIKLLPKDLSNMIAAGEVVERPASAVKELIENSIDAGSSLITVEISGGGLELIKVTDNGCGIHPDDVKNAFLRHATSKISKPEDLDSIYTLGFRGEALASIASVAKVSLYTRTEQFETGMTCNANFGEIEDVCETPGFVGTEIRVKNLFYNTPARLKFLKKDFTEAGYVEEVVKKTAIAHPEISFRLIVSGKEKLFTPGDGSLINTIFALYGNSVTDSLLEAGGENEGIKISGFVSNPVAARKTRNMQFFYVNHRAIVSKLAANAAEEALKGLIPANMHPICFINISVPAGAVDVNVHPSKLEVKFSDEQRVYRAVYYAVKNAVARRMMPKLEEKEEAFTAPFEAPATPSVLPQAKDPNEALASLLASASPKKEGFIPPFASSAERTSAPTFNEAPKSYSSFTEEKTADFEKAYDAIPNIIKKTENYVQLGVELEDKIGYNIIGQLFYTYILVERDNELILVDQHAAHEHITYAKLVKSFENRSIVSQTLLSPEVVTLNAVEKACVLENEEFFKGLGFELENFGGNDLLVRSIPENTDIADISGMLSEIAENLKKGRLDAGTAAALNALHTVACRASIKAGKKLEKAEAENLVKTLFEIDKTITCPHGRPAWFSIDRQFIEKQFKRIK